MGYKGYGWVVALLLPALSHGQEIERFAIERFQVEGNTLLPAAEVERLVAPYTGAGRDFGDIQRALEALELAYRERGYTAVQVYAPEQELTQGTVRLDVTETRVGQVILPEGLKYFDAANLRAGLPALQEGSSPNTLRLSREIALNNESPAKQVEVVLGVGQQEGTVDAKVKATEYNPVKVFASLDNTGTHQTGEHRLSFGVQNANLFDRDHVITAAYVTSPEKPDAVNIGSLSYRLPFYAQAGAVDLIVAKSNVDAGTTATTAGPLNFTGKGDVFGIKYTHTLPRQGEYSAKLVAGFDYKAYKNACSVGSLGAAGCGSAGASATVKPITLTYSGLKIGPGRATDYSLSLVQNIPGGNLGDDDAFRAVRPSPTGGEGAKANYHILRFGITHLRLFEGDWQVRAAANGQWTNQALLAYEQLGLAGSTAVRGFLEREVARDIGYYVNLEGYTPDFASSLGLDNTSLRALAFVDAASGRNHLLPGETQPDSHLASVGLGLRYGLGRDVAFKFDLARVTVANGARDVGDYRGHFNLTVSY